MGRIKRTVLVLILVSFRSNSRKLKRTTTRLVLWVLGFFRIFFEKMVIFISALEDSVSKDADLSIGDWLHRSLFVRTEQEAKKVFSKINESVGVGFSFGENIDNKVEISDREIKEKIFNQELDLIGLGSIKDKNS